jgi:CHAT domain-containing protein
MIPSNPLESNLRFTPDPKGRDRLTIADLFGLKLPVQLAVLSACETGKVGGHFPDRELPFGDELIGLVRGFMAAGVSSVIASLWKVDDPKTCELMTTFYNELRSSSTETKDIASTLRSAQIALLEKTQNPYFWAPFVLYGSWK